MKALLTALLLALVAPACLVHTHDRGAEMRRAGYSAPPRRCHPSHYWNGERCVHKGRGHQKHHHHD